MTELNIYVVWSESEFKMYKKLVYHVETQYVFLKILFKYLSRGTFSVETEIITLNLKLEINGSAVCPQFWRINVKSIHGKTLGHTLKSIWSLNIWFIIKPDDGRGITDLYNWEGPVTFSIKFQYLSMMESYQCQCFNFYNIGFPQEQWQ